MIRDLNTSSELYIVRARYRPEPRARTVRVEEYAVLATGQKEAIDTVERNMLPDRKARVASWTVTAKADGYCYCSSYQSGRNKSDGAIEKERAP